MGLLARWGGPTGFYFFQGTRYLGLQPGCHIAAFQPWEGGSAATQPRWGSTTGDLARRLVGGFLRCGTRGASRYTRGGCAPQIGPGMLPFVGHPPAGDRQRGRDFWDMDPRRPARRLRTATTSFALGYFLSPRWGLAETDVPDGSDGSLF